MKLLDLVSRRLAAGNAPHALIGAAALAIHGIARSTYDVDLLTTDRGVLEPVFWDPLRADGASIDARRGDHDDPLAGVVRVSAAGARPVDVIVGKWRWQARAVERAERLPDGPLVVAARDLVALKLYAGGTQDLWDVQALLALPDASVLIAAVDDDLADLPLDVRARWAQLRP
ncbi:MAG: hypothetical protein ABIT71_19145 [Vicinamibacteraceae bacterium]